jgi:hypothetical protein
VKLAAYNICIAMVFGAQKNWERAHQFSAVLRKKTYPNNSLYSYHLCFPQLKPKKNRSRSKRWSHRIRAQTHPRPQVQTWGRTREHLLQHRSTTSTKPFRPPRYCPHYLRIISHTINYRNELYSLPTLLNLTHSKIITYFG